MLDNEPAPGGTGEEVAYDGFMSYSHAADGLLAPRLQSALQRFAKPWWKRRAVRIFRDESSLSANPHLWSSITDALDTSGWFILLLSPDAASSEWVNQEIDYWVTNRDPKKILPVVTDGTFGWTHGDVDGDAVPPTLEGVFAEEPRWVDVRWARDEDQLDLKDPRFADAVADIASAIRGIPKDDLASEEVRQHRRTTRTAWAAGLLVTILAIAAVGFGIQATQNAEEAERQADLAERQAGVAQQNAEAEAEAREQADEQRQEAELARAEAAESARLARSRELAAAAISRLSSDPELATLLAVAAIDSTPASSTQPVEVINALWRGGQSNRLVGSIDTGFGGPIQISLAPDGRNLYVVSEEGASVQMYDARSLELEWTYTENTVDSFTLSDASIDGRLAVSVLDSSAAATVREVEGREDSLPARVLILDGDDGTLLRSIEFPECPSAEVPVWSPDGSLLVVNSGFEGCEREGTRYWNEIFDTRSWEQVAFLPAGQGVDGAPVARFDDAGSIYLLTPFAAAEAFDLDTLEPIELPGWSGIGDITPDGQTLVAGYSEGQVGLALNVYDRESNGRVDLLTPMPGQLFVPTGLSISGDGRYAFALSQARNTMVFDLDSGEVAFELPGGTGTKAEFDTSRQVAYTAHFDGTVRVWDLSSETTGIEIIQELGTASWINGDSFSIGDDLGSAVAIDFGSDEWFVRFFDLHTGAFAWSVPGLGATPLPGGTWAVLSPDGFVRLIEPGSGEIAIVGGCLSEDDLGTCSSTGRQYGYDQVLVSVDGNEVAVFRGGADGFASGEMQALDPTTGSLGPVEQTIDTGFRVVEAFSAEWILGRPSGLIVAKDRSTGDVLFERTTIPGIEISTSGDRAAFIDPGTGVVVVEFDDWEATDIPVDFNRIRGMAFSSDESQLMLIGVDRLYVVDLAQRAVAQVLEISGGSDAYWLSEDTFLIGTSDGIWGVGSLNTEDFLGSTRNGLRRSFTDAECATYRIDLCPTLEELKGG